MKNKDNQNAPMIELDEKDYEKVAGGSGYEPDQETVISGSSDNNQ